MGIPALIGEFFAMVAQLFGWATERSGLANTGGMQARKVADYEAEEQDRVNKAIAKRDVATIRNALAE
jgi:hypothetical protein